MDSNNLWLCQTGMTYPIPHPPPFLRSHLAGEQFTNINVFEVPPKESFPRWCGWKYTLPPCGWLVFEKVFFGVWKIWSFFLLDKNACLTLSGFGEGLLQRSVCFELCTRMKWKASFTVFKKMQDILDGRSLHVPTCLACLAGLCRDTGWSLHL